LARLNIALFNHREVVSLLMRCLLEVDRSHGRGVAVALAGTNGGGA
jgi:hypothetical protein